MKKFSGDDFFDALNNELKIVEKEIKENLKVVNKRGTYYLDKADELMRNLNYQSNIEFWRDNYKQFKETGELL